MNKRDFLKGLGALIATVAVLPKSLKAEVLNNTTISPVKARVFRVKYDSVALSYIKEVVGRTTPLTVREEKVNDGWVLKSVASYSDLVPPNLVFAAYYLDAHKKGGYIFADIA